MKVLSSILLISLLGILSCKKEVITETEYVYLTDSWTKSDEIDRLDMYITNSYANDERIVFSTPHGIIIKYQDGTRNYWLTSGSYKNKGVFLDSLFIRVSESQSRIGIASYYFGNPDYLGKWDTDSLPNYRGFGAYGLSSDWAAIRSDKKQYMFHYWSSQYTQSYCFVDFTSSRWNIRKDSVWAIQLAKDDVYYNINVKSFFNKYFICNGRGMEIVNGDGSHKPAFGIPDDQYFASVININGELYAFGENSIYISSTEGESWNPLVTNIPLGTIHLFDYQYYVMNDEIIMVEKDKIIHMLVSDTNITWKQVKNDGLENHRITGVAKFNETVYLSTTSGTFTKPYEEFFDYIE
jgi:hypothetical protein